MEARLTPAVILIAIAIGTVIGPLSTLGDVTTADLTDKSYWLDMLAATIRSFASVAVAGLGLVAGAWGLPALRERGKPGESPPG